MKGTFTFPPACDRTAKQKRVEGLAFPSTLNSPKAAACPSMGWDTFLSTEYSCIAPTTRFCCGTKSWPWGCSSEHFKHIFTCTAAIWGVGVHGCFYLSRDPYQQQPLLLLVSSIVDDLTTCQTGMPVKYFGRLGIPLHAPVVDSCICHQRNGVHWYPLPEHDVLCHSVSLQFTFHLNVEYLQCLGSWAEMRR